MPIEALNMPKNWDMINTSGLAKAASMTKDKGVDLNGFDLEAAAKEHPEHLFVKVFAIKKDEVNDNGDAFCEAELKRAAQTFIGCPVFVNHQNDDVEKARGRVMHAWYDDSAGGIYCINRVDKAAYPQLARGIQEGYITGCFPPDAPVLMSDGTEKCISDIEEGDYVISGKGNIKKVLGTRMRGYNYPLLSIEAEGIKQPLVCTSHHNLMVYRLPQECACGCGEDLPELKDSRITTKTFNRKFVKGHNTRGAKLKHEYIKKVKAHEIQEGDFLYEPQISVQNEKDTISEEQAYLIGLFLAEGSFEKRNGERHSVIFNYGHTELETLADRTVSLFEKAFPNYRNKPTINFYPGASQTRVSIYGKEIAEWFFKYCGEYSDGKKLDSSILSLSEDRIAEILAGYIEGDGYNVKGKTYGACTVSSDLASQLRLLFAKIGVRTNYRIRKSCGEQGWGYKPVHELTFGLTTAKKLREKLLFKQADIAKYEPASWHSVDDYVLRRVKNVTEVEYDGKVYDIEVEDDHTYCVNHVAVSNTSMGAQVGYSLCSICHNKAHSADEFCSHVKNSKTRKFSGKIKNAYHDSPCSPEDDDPLTGKKKGEEEILEHKEAQVFEWNYDIKFIEDSFVVNPACHDCLVCDILDVSNIQSKLSSQLSELQKVASKYEEGMAKNQISKTAGKMEIQALNDAMNLIEKVTRSILAQKQYVDMEYASDLVEVLADLQSSTDELIEMGYSSLPSPDEEDIAFGTDDPASPAEQGGAEQVSPGSIGQDQPSQQTSAPAQPQFSGVSSSPAAEVGTVTRPNFSAVSQDTKEEFTRTADNISKKLHRINAGLKMASQLWELRRKQVTEPDSVYEASSGSRKITIAKMDDGEMYVGEWQKDKLVSWSSADKYDHDWRMMMANKPHEAAKQILSSLEKESDSAMAKENKTAAGRGVTEEQAEVITQKQLDKANLELHGRQEDHYNTITEGSEQIGGDERVNDTTSQSPQVRKDNPYEFITEAQLQEITEEHMTRWSSYPEVITEKQWDEMSRLVSSILPDDWTESITQQQLISLRDSHSWVDPDFITQEQLENQGSTLPQGDQTARWKAASTFDAKALVEAATASVSDAIAKYNLSPADVRKAVAEFSRSPKHQMKAAYLTLVNALPTKIADRKAELHRNNYFAKVAGRKSSVKPIDGLLSAIADNIGYASAPDMLDAVQFVSNDMQALANCERIAMQKLASVEAEEEIVDKQSAFRNAFAQLEDDGLYKVCGTFNEDLGGVDLNDRSTFLRSVLAYSQEKLNGAEVILSNVKVDEDLGIFEAVLKSASVATEEEKTAFSSLGLNKAADAKSGRPESGESFSAYVNSQHDDDDEDSDRDKKTASRKSKREELVREAQMMGGQMPAGLGDGGAGGASLPMPPGEAGGEAVESFDAGADEGFDDAGSGDLEAAPPGSRCPVCGSDDVDIISGKGACNNCGAEYAMKVDIEVLKWPGTMEGESGDDAGDEFGGEGLALEDDGLDQELPVAAFTRITDKAMEKLASSKIVLGSVSPYTGSTDTVALGDGKYVCLETGNRYSIRQAMKGDDLYLQWEWTHRPAAMDCEPCKSARKTFASALKDFGLNSNEFDRMSLADRGRTILAMNDKGLLRRVKTASVEGNSLRHFKQAYAIGDKFPVERCRELIARRFGENAIAMSGPDEGSNLADSICKRLSTAGIYSDNIAIKVAETWKDPDGCVMCLEDFIRGGFTAKQASFICDQLRTKYAQAVEFLADELDGDFDDGGMDEAVIDDAPMDGFEDSFDDSVDPFSDDMGGGEFVTVNLPLDVLETFDEEIDKALGVDPATEKHHDESVLPEGDVEMALPEDAAEDIGEVADEALDTAVEVADGIEDAFEGDDDDDDPFDGGPSGSDADGEPDDADKEGMGMSMPSGMGDMSTMSAETAENKKESSSDSQNAEDNSEEEHSMREASDMADVFKKGRISSSHKVNLDLSAVAELLNKRAGDSSITHKNVQDDSDTKPYSASNGSAMGHEDKFSAEDPSAPSAGTGATMGNESNDLAKTDVPTVPAGGSPMGNEGEQGYTPEKGHDHTGGDKGAGNSKAASTKAQQDDLAERLIATADSKLDEAKPVSDDGDVQPISNNKDHSHTPEGSKIKPFEESDHAETDSVPEEGSGAFMGHEEESIGDVPKAPDHQPEIPEGGGVNEHYDKNDRYAPEKQTDLKGTVIARSDEESKTARQNAAIRVAGRMLEAKRISAEQLPAKIAELERYEVEQIKDFEKAMFGVVRKGLDTVAQGSETALVIPESSNVKDASTELTKQIQGLFELDRRNRAADDDPNADLKR